MGPLIVLAVILITAVYVVGLVRRWRVAYFIYWTLVCRGFVGWGPAIHGTIEVEGT